MSRYAGGISWRRWSVVEFGLQILATLTPTLLWAKAVWLSPFLRTHRPCLSGVLSLLAGALMSASIAMDDRARPVLFGASGLVLAAMFATLLWPHRDITDRWTR